MSKVLLLVFISLFVGMTLAANPGFRTKRLNMESYQITLKTQSQVNAIADFLESFNGYYLHSGRIALNKNLEILVQKEFKNIFHEAMRKAGINYSILYERVKIKMYGDNQRLQRPRATTFLKQEGCLNASCDVVKNCCSGYICQTNPFAPTGSCILDAPPCKAGGDPCSSNIECCGKHCVPTGTGTRGLCG